MPFRGSGPALNALLGGQVDYVCDQTVGVVPSIQGGQAKGLVVATPERLSVVPDVPTSKEQGLPDFQAVGWNALFAPKGTPRDIVMKINAAARQALDDPKHQEAAARTRRQSADRSRSARRNGSASMSRRKSTNGCR